MGVLEAVVVIRITTMEASTDKREVASGVMVVEEVEEGSIKEDISEEEATTILGRAEIPWLMLSENRDAVKSSDLSQQTGCDSSSLSKRLRQ